MAREFLSRDEAFDRIADRLPYQGPLPGSDTAGRHAFLVGDRSVTVGFIAPLSEPFCAECDRLRLDAHGRLFGCLRERDGIALSDPLRQGDPDEVDRRISDVVRSKHRPEGRWPARAMAHIGG
jgi:GTP 3',8-cyclase